MSPAIQDATACREALARLPKLGLGEFRQQWRVLYKAEASQHLRACESFAQFCGMKGLQQVLVVAIAWCG